jgi:hypothetical protein
MISICLNKQLVRFADVTKTSLQKGQPYTHFLSFHYLYCCSGIPDNRQSIVNHDRTGAVLFQTRQPMTFLMVRRDFGRYKEPRAPATV